MPNVIKPKRRTGSTGVPNVSSMQDGEIAINSFDKKVFMRVGANLVEVANAAAGDWNTLLNRPANLVSWAGINPTTKLNTSAYTAADVLDKVKSVDGINSGLDADLLDGRHAAYFTDYVQSRGLNLTTNGSGLMGDNTNFSYYTFDPIDLPAGAAGAFKTSAYNGNGFSDELIPVDPNRTYRMSVMVKGTGSEGHRFYVGYHCYDADGLGISHQLAFHIAGTETTLAKDLNPGDTSFELTDATAWTTAASNRWYIGAHPYTNSKGYTYPEYTYSRRVWMFQSANVTPAPVKTGNVISFNQPYTGEFLPAGTKVAQHLNGASYNYNVASNLIAPADWTEYSGTFEGTASPTVPSGASLRPGTAFIKWMTLHNREVPGGTTSFTNFSLELDHPLTTTQIIAGSGLTGGGTIAADRTIALGTPSNITLSSTNATTATSHTHNFVPGGTTAQYIRGDGSLASFPSIPAGTVTSVSAGNGMTFTTITGAGTVTLGTPGTLSGSTTNAVQANSHTHALSANLSAWDGISPNTKIGTTGDWTMGGKLHLSDGTLQVSRHGQGTPGIEIGTGWSNGHDGIGWVINRFPTIPLRLAGRNQGAVLSIGETATQTTLTAELLVTGSHAGLAFQNRDNHSQQYTWYATNGGAFLWNSGSGNLLGLDGGLHIYGGWVRTHGNTGWYSQTHGGGWYMEDATWIRNYNSKRVLIATEGGSEGDLCLSSTSPTIRFHDTDAGTNSWLHCNNGQHGFLANNAYSWATYRNASNDWVCMGNIIAYASDARLKTNVNPVRQEAVDYFFDNIQIKEFDWDFHAIASLNPGFNPSTPHETGGIAQEFERVLPSMVSTHANGIKTINWEKATPYLVAEVQRLRGENRQLINTLQNMLSRLETLERR